MKKAAILVAILILVCLGSMSVFADELTLKAVSKNEWEMYNQTKEFVGRLKRLDSGSYTYQDQSDNYKGKILESGKWIPRIQRSPHHRIIIDPESAQLYLDVLKIIKKIQ